MNIVVQYNQRSLAVIVAAVVVIVGGIIWISRAKQPTEQATQPKPNATNPAVPVSDGIDVDVSRVSQTGGSNAFTIALNTHSGDLSTYDAATNVLFRSTNGSTTLPIKVDGDRETHHRTIEVSFKDLVFPGTLLINNLGSIKERSFEFSAKD